MNYINYENHKSKTDDYPDVLNPKMISELLGIGYLKSLTLMKSGQFAVKKIGNTYHTSKSEFLRWLNEPNKS